MEITGSPGLDRDEIERLMHEAWIARIATHGSGQRIRLSPLWFCWAGGKIYAFTRGQKVEDLRRNPVCTFTVDRNERYPELHGVMWEGSARVLEDAAAEAADEHLDPVVRDRMGEKYAQGGFGNPAKRRNESTAMGKSWRWIVFTPERAFTWDNAKLARRSSAPRSA
jgi:nitroimidazol reductase NimA-like FMN-containing flavoprotein (pyridoxamine 5'-phosphate oxidase superfamily)